MQSRQSFHFDAFLQFMMPVPQKDLISLKVLKISSLPSTISTLNDKENPLSNLSNHRIDW